MHKIIKEVGIIGGLIISLLIGTHYVLSYSWYYLYFKKLGTSYSNYFSMYDLTSHFIDINVRILVFVIILFLFPSAIFMSGIYRDITMEKIRHRIQGFKESNRRKSRVILTCLSFIIPLYLAFVVYTYPYGVVAEDYIQVLMLLMLVPSVLIFIFKSYAKEIILLLYPAVIIWSLMFIDHVTSQAVKNLKSNDIMSFKYFEQTINPSKAEFILHSGSKGILIRNTKMKKDYFYERENISNIQYHYPTMDANGILN